MKRRTFLRHTAHSLAIPSFLGALGNQSFGQTLDTLLRLAENTEKVLVLIYLEGGNDGLNTIIPMGSYGNLTKVRPHVILPENKILLPNTGDFGFHPSLSGFQRLYNEGRLQIIHSAGYPNQHFSHFRSSDIWMSGSDADTLVPSGWTGRYLEAMHPQFPEDYPNATHTDPLALEIGHGSSLLFQGEKANFSMVINDANSFYKLLENTFDQTPDTPAGDKLRHIRLIARQSQKYGAVVKKAAENTKQQRPYPDKNRLARQLQIVSRLIAGGLKTPLYLVRIGGFDTHDNQVEGHDHTLGNHAKLLKEVNDAVMAFMADLEFQGTADRVLGMTFSEFGRRIVSNASMGTDHGSSAPLFIFGNQSYGGAQGSAPQIKGNEVYRDNLPFQHDFRHVYSSLLNQWLGSSEAATAAATFGQSKYIPVVKGELITSIEQPRETAVKLFPNPVVKLANLQLTVGSGKLKVDLYGSSGKHLAQVFEGLVKQNPFSIAIDMERYPSGRYILKVIDGNQVYTLHVLKI